MERVREMARRAPERTHEGPARTRLVGLDHRLEREAASPRGRLEREVGSSGSSSDTAIDGGDALAQRLSLSAGEPLPGSERRPLEARFGYDLSRIRIHRDERAARLAESAYARAFNAGRHLVFGRGEFRPQTLAGRQLVSHELAHSVQHTRGQVPADTLLRQPQTRQQLLKRLAQKEVELAQVKARAAALNPVAGLRARGTVSTGLVGGVMSSATTMLKRAIRVRQSGSTVRLAARFQITFLGQGVKAGQQRARQEIPRIQQAIRRSWTVKITKGAYAGYTFILAPSITYRPPTQKRDQNAFQIQVRAKDDGKGSSGTWWNGVIDLNPVHLQGSRVVVVAHEVAHLFGEFDAYLKVVNAKKKVSWAVGRHDPQNRPDLVGLIDPVGLKNRLERREITQKEYQRQTGSTPKVWEEDASRYLAALGVKPLAKRFQQQAAQQLHSDVVQGVVPEFERRRDMIEVGTKMQKLEQLRAKRGTYTRDLTWLQTVERVLQLEKEVKALRQQIKTAPNASSP